MQSCLRLVDSAHVDSLLEGGTDGQNYEEEGDSIHLSLRMHLFCSLINSLITNYLQGFHSRKLYNYLILTPV